MAKVVLAASAFVAILAILLSLFPSLRVWSPEQASEESLRIRALAAAQSYRATTILDDPLLIYLDDFLSGTEIDEILNASSSLFVPSQVYNADKNAPAHRMSSSCLLPEDHELNAVITSRVMSFLSGLNANPTTDALSYYGIEDIQLVKYLPDQYYHYHMDWFEALKRDNLPGKGERGRGRGRLYNRVASFFIYLQDDCEGGETEFPDLTFQDQTAFWETRIRPNTAQEADPETTGVAFKPRKGSGVFWVNLQPVGFGDKRLRHAGLPVKSGQKVGMNIWVKRDFGW